MNPGSGRFFTQDVYEGNSSDPLTLHKYLYANADGVNTIDPSGNFSIAEALITVSIITVLVTLSSCRAVPLPRPRVVSFIWDVTDDNWRKAADPLQISESDKELIKQNLYQSFSDAFRGFAVRIAEGEGTNRIRIGYSHRGDSGDPDTTGSTVGQNSDIYLHAAFAVARARGSEFNPVKTGQEVIQGVGRGLGHTAAHEFFHQITAELSPGVSQKHTNDPADIMWGTNAGVDPEAIPNTIYYGGQKFTDERKNVLKRLMPYSD